MDLLRQLTVLCLCAAAQSEPLRDAIGRRRDAFGVYASSYPGGYERMVLAVPLHAPMPVLRVLSRSPLAYSEPPYSYDYEAEYAPSEAGHEYAAAEPTLLYARPSAQGGYTYRRPGQRAAPARPPPPPRDDAPVILRIHKYKLTKDW